MRNSLARRIKVDGVTLRAAAVRPMLNGYLCIANKVSMWLPRCPSCGRPVATMQKVLKEAEKQAADPQLTWLVVTVTEGVEARGMGVKECTLKSD